MPKYEIALLVGRAVRSPPHETHDVRALITHIEDTH